MIHFDFTVSDADAENILSILREQIGHNNQRIIDIMAKPDGFEQQVYIEAYKRDNEYIEGLIKKMTNTRVEE